jgi:hypothetical protein
MAYAPPARRVRSMGSVMSVVGKGSALGGRGSRSLLALPPRPPARRVLVPEVMPPDAGESGVPMLPLTVGGVPAGYAPSPPPTGLLVDVYG